MIEISCDKQRLNVDSIHAFLTQTYWAKGRSLNDVKKSIEHSFCLGVYLDTEQIGFARIATDYTVFAYIMDVYILPNYRGKGYSKLLMKAINEAPELKLCKVWMLKTSDAHRLYEQFGFTSLVHPEKIMERLL